MKPKPQGPICVDAADQQLLLRHRWRRAAHGYVMRESLLLHRVIMQPTKTQDVDHINGDVLDNRRCNLRVCSHAENQRNNRRVAGPSGWRGVQKRSDNRYQARIRVNRTTHYLGTFESARDAALAYDEAAHRYHGAFATLNFSQEAVR